MEAAKGDTEEAWNLYLSLFDAYRVSDQGDFWAFFYQCWTILPLSLKLKLKTISMRLTKEAPLPPGTACFTQDNFRYTPVLTKQSAMFNAWKLLCDISEKREVSIRLAPMYALAEIQSGTLRPDKIRRYEAVSLEQFNRAVAER